MCINTAHCTATLTLLICFIFHTGTSENILAILPMPLPSHTKGFTPFLVELANRGHNVTVYTAYPIKDIPLNYHQIAVLDVSTILDLKVREHLDSAFDLITYNLFLWNNGIAATELTLQQPEIQKLIHSTDIHFDLIFVEACVQESYYTFAHKFNAPVIQFIPATPFPSTNYLNGNPLSCATIPDARNEFPTDMTLLQRFKNCYSSYFEIFWYLWNYLPKQQELADRYFKYEGSENKPQLSELLRNASVSLIHSDQTILHAKPNIPSFIEISYFHLASSKELPQDLQKIMDDSKDGVIFFSLGSWIDTSFFHSDKQNAVIEVFSKLPYTVLWKSDINSTLPKNIVARKWFPQIDILAHKKTKLFISHCGLKSVMETVYFGVPIVGIPFFVDQKSNVLIAVEKGYGKLVDWKNFTVESFAADIVEVINNPRYREKVQELSAIIKDKPLPPMETAIYWTERVLRHKGALHSHTSSSHLYWFQLYLLDVFAFLIIFIISLFLIIYYTSKKIIKKLKTRKCNYTKEKIQ